MSRSVVFRYEESFDSDQPPSYDFAVHTHNLPPICALCAGLLESPNDGNQNGMEALPENCQWKCCHRFACGKCIQRTPRLISYCPLCQVTIQPQHMVSFRKLPPSYDESPESAPSATALAEKPAPEAISGEVIHYVRPEDTVDGICLSYGIPTAIFRKHNRLFSDNLLIARRTVLIPAGYGSGASNSPTPQNGAEEQRKVQVKRFQLTTKCIEYKVAEWYLREAHWSLEDALMRWSDDDEWEREAIRRKRMGISGANSTFFRRGTTGRR